MIGALALTALVAAQGLADHPRELAIRPLPPYAPPRPERFELEGGPTLHVLTDTTLPLVEGLALFDVGTLDDPADAGGLVELLARGLRDGGTEAQSGPELDRWLEARGGRLDVRTTPDALVVEFSCLSEHTADVVEVLAALLRAPRLAEDALETARTGLASEVARERDDGSALADRMLLRAAYGPDSPLARTRTLEELRTITRDELLAFHRAHLGADRLRIGFAGNVAAEPLRELVAETFGGWAAAEPRRAIPAPAFLQPRSPVVHVVDRPGVTQTELRLTSPGVRRLHPDHAALHLWSHAVGAGGAANRMMMRVRTELGLAYTVGAYFRAGWSMAGRFEGWCGTRNEAVGEALDAMLDVLRSASEPLGTEELEAVRARVLNGRVFEIDTPLEVLEHGLLLDFYGYPPDFHAGLEEKLRALTATDVAEAVARHLDLGRLIVVAVGPAAEIEPRLAGFGELVRLDATGAPRDAALPRLAEELLAALGGRERWAALTSLHRTDVLEIPTGSGALEVPRETWQTSAPARTRSDVTVQDRRTAIVLTPDSCFSRSGANLEDLPPDQCAARRARADGGLYRLLHLLASDAIPDVSAPAEDELVARFESGLVCSVRVGADGRPTSLRTSYEGVEEFWEFLAWSETDGYRWFVRARERNNGTEVETATFEPNGAVDEELFRDPRQEERPGERADEREEEQDG